MTNFLDIIHRLFFIITHNVSETGVCLRHQVKDTYSVGPEIVLAISIGPNRIGVIYLMAETDSILPPISNINFIGCSVIAIECKFCGIGRASSC
jgi:hypothetical protein